MRSLVNTEMVCSRPSSQTPNASRGSSGHEVPLGVEHGRRNHHQVHPGLEPARVADDLRRGLEGHRQRDAERSS